MDASRQETETSQRPGLSQPPHCLSYTAVLEQLSTDADDGLANAEARSRLDTYGLNRLDEGEGISIGKILLQQIANAMMLVSVACLLLIFSPLFLQNLASSLSHCEK